MTLGIIGFGQFGQFMAKHLQPHFDVFVYDIQDFQKEAENLSVKFVNLEQVASKEIVIIAIPVQFQEELLKEIKVYVKPNALVFDVSSVKVKPVELMQKYLPPSVEIIGTHPIFGPQSGKNGIEGLKMVVCPVRTKHQQKIQSFLEDKLKLKVITCTPDEHDQQMAYVMSLTHLIGRAFNSLNIPDLDQKTQSYQYLLNIKENLKYDSLDLFLTIQKENPYGKKIVKEFVNKIKELEGLIE